MQIGWSRVPDCKPAAGPYFHPLYCWANYIKVWIDHWLDDTKNDNLGNGLTNWQNHVLYRWFIPRFIPGPPKEINKLIAIYFKIMGRLTDGICIFKWRGHRFLFPPLNLDDLRIKSPCSPASNTTPRWHDYGFLNYRPLVERQGTWSWSRIGL